MSWLPKQLAVRGTAGLVLGALLLAGCSTKKTETATAVPGVTDKVIKLGVLTDRTGPFAAAGKSVEQGRNLFWDAQNAKGGVCGRQVEFVVRDHGYNAQHAVSAYAQVKTEVLAIDELLGSPMIAALLPNLQTDQMLTLAVSWSSNLLVNPYAVITGTTYDIEMINGVQHLIQAKKLAKGDTVGHIFLEGDYGENAVAGSRAAAKGFGLKLVERKIKPTDADLTAQVTALRAEGAKAVLLTTTPPQTASALGVAQASGFDAVFLGNNPSFSPALLASPAKGALEKKFLVVNSIAPFSATAAGPAEVRKAFLAKYPGQPKTSNVMYGYAQGAIMAQILQATCKDLTRPGLLKSFQGLRNADTRGLVAPLDYSTSGAIPARQTYILRPDASADGGLTQVQGLFAAPLAITYKPTR